MPKRKKRQEQNQHAIHETLSTSRSSESSPSLSSITRKREKRQHDDKNSFPSSHSGGGGSGEVWSKSKKKRMRKLKAKNMMKMHSKETFRQEYRGDGPSSSDDKKKRSSLQNSPKQHNGTTNPSPSITASHKNGPNETKQEVKKRAEIQQQHLEKSPAKYSKSLSLKNSSRNSSTSSTSSRLQASFSQRLAGSRFRLLNEELYTTSSVDSFQRFSNNPELFHQYHTGFRCQVEQWPVNPVDVIVRRLVREHGGAVATESNLISQSQQKKKKEKKPQAISNDANYTGIEKIVVADFGCGDAALAKKLLAAGENTPFTVHSFDLVATNEFVTACDMSNVPLVNSSVDVVVFCLSLMGTNLADFVREAHRVLKSTGWLYIAEVQSRFDNNDDDAQEHSLSSFVRALEKLGFSCRQKDLTSNKMFFLLVLQKRTDGKGPDAKLSYAAKPCVYKKR